MNKLISSSGMVLDWNPTLGRYVEDLTTSHIFAGQSIIHIIPYGSEFLAVTLQGTLRKTTNNGLLWEKVLVPLDYTIESIFITNTGTWLLGVQENKNPIRCGVLRSTDEGITWNFYEARCFSEPGLEPAAVLTENTVIKQFAQEPFGQLVAVGGSSRYSVDNFTEVSPSHAHAWHSFNDGETWTLFAHEIGAFYWQHVVWNGTYFFIPTFLISAYTIFGVGENWDTIENITGQNVASFWPTFFDGRFVFFSKASRRLTTTVDFVSFSDYILSSAETGILLASYLHLGKLRVIASSGKIYEITGWGSSENFIGTIDQPIGLCAQVGTNLVLAHRQFSSDIRDDLHYEESRYQGVTYQSNDGGLTLNQISWNNLFIPLVYFNNRWVYFPDAPPKEGYKRIAHSETLGGVPTYIDIPNPYDFEIAGFHELIITNEGHLLIAPSYNGTYSIDDVVYPIYLVELENLIAPIFRYRPLLAGNSFYTGFNYPIIIDFSPEDASSSNQQYIINGFAASDTGKLFFINCEYYTSSPNRLLDNAHYTGFFSESTISKQVYLEDTFLNHSRDVNVFNRFRGAVFHNGKFYVFSSRGNNDYNSLWESVDGINFTGRSLLEIDNFDSIRGQAFLFSGINCLCIAKTIGSGASKIYSMLDGNNVFTEVLSITTIIRLIEKCGSIYVAITSSAASPYIIRLYNSLWNQINTISHSNNNPPLQTFEGNFIPQYVVAKDGLVIIHLQGRRRYKHYVIYKKIAGTYSIVSPIETSEYPLANDPNYSWIKNVWLGTYIKSGTLYRVRLVQTDSRTESLLVLFEAFNETNDSWITEETIHTDFYEDPSGGTFRFIESTGILYSWDGAEFISWVIDTNLYTIQRGNYLAWGTACYRIDAPVFGLDQFYHNPTNKYRSNSGNRELIYWTLPLDIRFNGEWVHKFNYIHVKSIDSIESFSIIDESTSNTFQKDRISGAYTIISDTSRYLSAPNTLDQALYNPIVVSPDHTSKRSTGNTLGTRSFNGTFLRDWSEAFTGSELTTKRGIGYSLNDGNTWGHVALQNVIAYSGSLYTLSTTLIHAVVGGGKYFIISRADLHYSSDLIYWERVPLSAVINNCMDFIDDIDFLNESPPIYNIKPGQMLNYLAGGHLLRSLNWTKKSQYFLGLVTQIDPPIEVSSSGYARQTLPVSNEHWTTSFSNVQRYPFQPFDATIVGWAIFDSDANLLHVRPFPSTITCTSGTPGLVLLPGDFTFTID